MNTTHPPASATANPAPEVIFCECFVRDGLQHESRYIETAVKSDLLDRFTRIGFPRIEATSFAHPKNVPQFADAETLLQQMKRRPGTRYKATCANMHSVNRALAARDQGYGPEEISFIISATESHTKKNLNRSRAEQWALIEQMAEVTRGKFVLVGALSMILGCSFEGAVDPKVVVEDIRHFVRLGVTTITLGETSGMGTPISVKNLVRDLRDAVPEATLVAHFHNTRGTAMTNCIAAWEAGVTHFDSSFGGIGGHPAKIKYGEGNTGNVPTEDLAVLFESMGVNTGLDMALLMDTAHFCEQVLERELLSMMTRTSFDGTKPLRLSLA